MQKRFYRAFEDRFRGSSETIKSRLKIYITWINKLKSMEHSLKVLDLGCGRGEWLELLSEASISAVGVDDDTYMLEACNDKNLTFIKNDIFEFLQSVTDQSYHIISAFHVAEHLPFLSLELLIKESFRILKPGGLLIIETPNPENLSVGATTFYIDPTHQRPIFPDFLIFLTEYMNFYRSKILRLQESPCLKTREVQLLDVLTGVSPDFAVIAQKQGDHEHHHIFNEDFDKEYGITLPQLAEWYDKKYDNLQEKMSHLDLQYHQKIAAIEATIEKNTLSIDLLLQKLQKITSHPAWRLFKKIRTCKNYLISFLKNVSNLKKNLF